MKNYNLVKTDLSTFYFNPNLMKIVNITTYFKSPNKMKANLKFNFFAINVVSWAKCRI